MGKSLKELFQTKQFADGKTLAQKYDIRNSKDAEISTAAGGLGLPFKAATKVRRAFSQTKGETFIEEEVTGLRIINTLSAPITYGTDLIRLTKQSTEMVTTMKNGTGASSGDAGIVGNFLNKAKDTAGTLVGKFLAKNATGTPKQILNGVIGGGIAFAKDKVRGKLFGGRTEGQQLYAKKSSSFVQFDSKAPYSTVVDKSNEKVENRNDLSSILSNYELFGLWNSGDLSDIYQSKNQLGKEVKVGKAGVAPKGKFVNPKPDPIKLAKSRKQGQIEVGIKIKP
jgi:hypothetical protein